MFFSVSFRVIPYGSVWFRVVPCGSVAITYPTHISPFTSHVSLNGAQSAPYILSACSVAIIYRA